MQRRKAKARKTIPRGIVVRPGTGHSQPSQQQQQQQQIPSQTTQNNTPTPAQSLLSAPSLPPPTGEKKQRKVALLVGCEYEFASADILPLHGCHNDVRLMHDLLLQSCGYEQQDIQVLTDTKQHANTQQYPTRANIVSALTSLVTNCQQDSCIKHVFLYFSGHGTQQADENRDEKDGLDECFVPVDFATGGLFVDDTIRSICNQFPKTVDRVVFVADCCHSGSLLDLPFSSTNDRTAQEATNGPLDFMLPQAEPVACGSIKSKPSATKSLVTPESLDHMPATPVLIELSGCRDDQTSASGKSLEPGVLWQGALTFCLRHLFSAFSTMTWADMVENVRSMLKQRHFSQQPQLSMSVSGLFDSPCNLFG